MVIPKPARVSALRAELTALNHRLPAEVRDSVPNPALSLTVSRFVCHYGAPVLMKLQPFNLFPHLITALFGYHLVNALC
jgi:hypothetical protein